MPSRSGLAELERERERMYAKLREVGEFRPGTLNAVPHRCGKRDCVCADPRHPGHGEDYIVSKKVAGKTVAAHFRSEPALDKARREVANYKRFPGLVQKVVEVSEKICEAQPVSTLAADPPSGDGKEGRS